MQYILSEEEFFKLGEKEFYEKDISELISFICPRKNNPNKSYCDDCPVLDLRTIRNFAVDPCPEYRKCSK